MKSLYEIGLDKNYVGSCFVSFVMFPPHTLSVVVLQLHVLVFFRFNLFDDTVSVPLVALRIGGDQ